jgi:hypothetical protein
MRWVRSHIRGGAHIALGVLALQLVLSFGHGHLDRPATSLPQKPFAALSDDGLLALPTASVPLPSDDSEGVSDDNCPICSLSRLASWLVPGASPALLLPFVLISAVTTTRLDQSLQPRKLSFYRARAPPIA